MQKKFNDPSEILLDEGFQAWFRDAGDQRASEWISWMNENQGSCDMIAAAVYIMEQLHVPEKSVAAETVEKAVLRLKGKLAETEKGKGGSHFLMQRWWWAAAIFLLLAGAGSLWVYHNSSFPSIQADYGQVLKQELPDGSLVTLNANSKIELGKNFQEAGQREVWLKGEAFFHVKKTSDKKRFIVHTGHFDIVVTGTQFNVVNRGDRNSVLLTEGRVELDLPDGKSLVLKPGDYFELKQNSQVEKSTVPQEKVLAWKDRKLIFENTKLSEAAAQITDLYNVEISFSDSGAANTTLTGILPNNNLDVLIIAIEAATGLTANRQDAHKIVFQKLKP